jgi:hypothetical protein
MGAFCCKEGEANNLHNRRLHQKKTESKMKIEVGGNGAKRKMVTGKTFKVWKVTNFYYI